MTRSKGEGQKIAELNAVFATLTDQGKASALAILKALCFAQAVMGADIPCRSKPRCSSATCPGWINPSVVLTDCEG